MIHFLLHKGDIVFGQCFGEVIPCDGEVIEGGASVDESAITGESAPVIRESGGDFSSVTGGTRVLSDWLIIRCSAEAGNSFLDRVIDWYGGKAKRRKRRMKIALTILLTAPTLIFFIRLYHTLSFCVCLPCNSKEHGEGYFCCNVNRIISLSDPYNHRRTTLFYWCGRYEPDVRR